MATEAVLALAQTFCRLMGLPVVSALQGSSDAGALQIRGILQEVGDDIWRQTNWKQCARRIDNIASTGVEVIGDMDTLFPDNFDHIIPNTFWDLTERRPITGPIYDSNWQAHKAYSGAGPVYSYAVIEDELRVYPVMAIGHTLSCFYKSKNWIRVNGGAVGNRYFANDEDKSVFSDDLMLAGLKAFWLRAKEMPHRFEMERYEDLKMSEAAKNTTPVILSLDGSDAYGSNSTYGIMFNRWRT